MIAGARLPRETAGGTAFVRRGAGPPVVLLHGVGMRAEAWTPQIEHLSRSHDVIAVDLLGHGGSDAPPDDPELGHYVDQVARLMPTLGIGPAAVVGHSLGGLVALGLALDHPSLCRGVAALNAVHCRDAASRDAVIARAEEIARTRSPGDIDAPLARWFGDEPGVREGPVCKSVRHWLTSVDPAGYAAAYSVFARSDAAHRGRLAGLAMPALFATGELDPNSTPAMSRAMAAEVPAGEAVVIAGARHMMNLVQVDDVNRLLDRFLARCRG